MSHCTVFLSATDGHVLREFRGLVGDAGQPVTVPLRLFRDEEAVEGEVEALASVRREEPRTDRGPAAPVEGVGAGQVPGTGNDGKETPRTAYVGLTRYHCK